MANNNVPFYDYDEVVKRVEEITGYPKRVIIDILDANEVYMTEKGIMDGNFIKLELGDCYKDRERVLLSDKDSIADDYLELKDALHDRIEYLGLNDKKTIKRLKIAEAVYEGQLNELIKKGV